MFIVISKVPENLFLHSLILKIERESKFNLDY